MEIEKLTTQKLRVVRNNKPNKPHLRTARSMSKTLRTAKSTNYRTNGLVDVQHAMELTESTHSRKVARRRNQRKKSQKQNEQKDQDPDRSLTLTQDR